MTTIDTGEERYRRAAHKIAQWHQNNHRHRAIARRNSCNRERWHHKMAWSNMNRPDLRNAEQRQSWFSIVRRVAEIKRRWILERIERQRVLSEEWKRKNPWVGGAKVLVRVD